MKALWKRLLKKAAGVAFQWGLKKLTELSPEDIKDGPKAAPRKPRTRKPYAH